MTSRRRGLAERIHDGQRREEARVHGLPLLARQDVSEWRARGLWGQIRPGAGPQQYRLRIRRGGAWAWLGGTHSTDANGVLRLRVRAPAGSLVQLYSSRTALPASPCASSSDRRPRWRCPCARFRVSSDGPPRGTGRHPSLRRHRRPRRRLVRRRGGADLRAHRPERRGEDDCVQRHHAPLQAGLGRGAARRLVDPEGAGAQDRRQGHRAHVPEPPALPDDVRARERPHRSARAGAERGGEGGVRGARRGRSPRARALPRRRAAVRDPEARRARARARREAAAAPARRAGRRPEPR